MAYGDEMLNTVKAIKTALGGESGGETYGSELLNTVIEIKDLVESGGGGGGSSLPSYTSADEGKVLGLAEDAEHSTTETIVPEQSVTIVDTDVSVEVEEELVLGETYTFTVNDVVQSLECVQLGPVSIGVQFENDSGEYSIAQGGGDISFLADDPDTGDAIPGTYIVSLTKSVPSVAPAWVGGVPDYSAASDGDVLTIVDGVPTWVTP